MNYKKPLFGTLIVSAVVSMAFIGMSLAQNVTIQQGTGTELGQEVAKIKVNDDEFIILSGLDSSPTAVNHFTNALDQVEVNEAGTSFTITTALVSGYVKIKNTRGVDMGKKTSGDYYNSATLPLTSCDSDGSVLTITANITSAVTVVVTPPTDHAGCSSISTGATVTAYSGGGSGGTGATQTETTKTKDEKTKQKPEPTDKYTKFIAAIERVMKKNKTWKSSLKSKAALTNAVAVRIALAVMGEKCDSVKRPSDETCLEKAIEKALLEKDATDNTRVIRAQNYSIWVKALDLPLIEASADDLKKECSDVKKPTDEMAAIFMTAKKYNLVMKSGTKCGLEAPLMVGEAAVIANKARAARLNR